MVSIAIDAIDDELFAKMLQLTYDKSLFNNTLENFQKPLKSSVIRIKLSNDRIKELSTEIKNKLTYRRHNRQQFKNLFEKDTIAFCEFFQSRSAVKIKLPDSDYYWYYNRKIQRYCTTTYNNQCLLSWLNFGEFREYSKYFDGHDLEEIFEYTTKYKCQLDDSLLIGIKLNNIFCKI